MVDADAEGTGNFCMTDLDEFQEGLRGISLNLDLRMLHDILYDVWQAARASRWRSMESAPDKRQHPGVKYHHLIGCITPNSRTDEPSWSAVVYPCKFSDWTDRDGGSPIAWHPLPDPPTSEELEKLK